METLKLYRGDQLLSRIVLGDRPLELGRGPGCDVVLDDPGLAERHWLAVRRLGTVVAYDVSAGRGGEARHVAFGEGFSLGSEHRLVRESDALVPRTPLARDTEALRVERSACRTLSVLIGSGSDARRQRVGERPLHIGRGAENDLVLADRAASLRHCRLEPSGEGLLLRDLGSSNGTYVNGVRVERALVSGGARICVGRTELCVIERGANQQCNANELVAESTAMLALLAEAERAASLPWPALVLGESGSGKEGIAELLHKRGPRSGKPWVALNAGGIAPELIESELFGHERGAFTGANASRRGVFEQADGGTLFLDEIGELPLGLQARLLRVLESGEVRRVGAESAKQVDVRVVCATHRDLRALVAAGEFREDLYFRLARIVLEVPPLRAHPADIPALGRRFVRDFEPVTGPHELAPDALTQLCAYPWPGNVRELRNAIAAAAAAAPAFEIGAVEIERALARVGGHGFARASVTLEALRLAIAQHRGNLSAAARALRIPRSTLRDRLRQLGAASG